MSTSERVDAASGAAGPVPGTGDGDPVERTGRRDELRRANEKRNERYVWWYLAYFLFGIHLVAFVMIFAVMHGK
ncbi:hypothetical protein HUT18_20495 [Streptomyces sp. NA04227]|uniref:hypothetical protein n=1 Tax=Streptomyces sp. NA04227 TaxID=2742136 RepID=UPI00158FB4E8|nr:hypothetical protein [Streptomyces sp. NA04227]QKW04966.1 hypothetical protein HUT18_20495 [Streptomyces sp. NA04227]